MPAYDTDPGWYRKVRAENWGCEKGNAFDQDALSNNVFYMMTPVVSGSKSASPLDLHVTKPPEQSREFNGAPFNGLGAPETLLDTAPPGT